MIAVIRGGGGGGGVHHESEGRGGGVEIYAAFTQVYAISRHS